MGKQILDFFFQNAVVINILSVVALIAYFAMTLIQHYIDKKKDGDNDGQCSDRVDGTPGTGTGTGDTNKY